MAKEAEIINNPDSTPGAVSTGYQLQNTNLVSQRTGIDKTYVSGGAGTVTVEISGPVDVNGVLYDVKSQTVLTPSSAGRYYITLQGAGPQYLTPTLGTSAGTFDPLKNARYDASNYRVLNWVVYFDGTTCYANRLLTPETEHTEIKDLDTPEEEWITVSGNWIAPRSKYYTIYVTGCGGIGGRGGDGDSGYSGGNAGAVGGYAGSTGIKRIWIDAGDVWTAAFTTGASATTFTDGTTTLSAGNQGGSVSGCDITFIGAGYGYGGNGSSNFDHPGHPGSNGGSSFWGSGGGGGSGGLNSNGSSGGAAQSYGGGGGCGGGGGRFGGDGPTYSGGSGGAGRQGIIRIVG